MTTMTCGGMEFAVFTADAGRAAGVAERAYWDCRGAGVFVPEYHGGGFAVVDGEWIGWRRVK